MPTEHTLIFTTEELSGILSTILATLAEGKPQGEFQTLEDSLVSAAEKICKELKLPQMIV